MHISRRNKHGWQLEGASGHPLVSGAERPPDPSAVHAAGGPATPVWTMVLGSPLASGTCLGSDSQSDSVRRERGAVSLERNWGSTSPRIQRRHPPGRRGPPCGGRGGTRVVSLQALTAAVPAAEAGPCRGK